MVFYCLCLSFPFLSQFSDELSKIWRYYDAFLTQTEMLHIGPFHELANSFVNLKVCQPFLVTERERERERERNLTVVFGRKSY